MRGIKSLLCASELRLNSFSAYLVYSLRTGGLVFRKDHDYAQVWITQRASGATAPGA